MDFVRLLIVVLQLLLHLLRLLDHLLPIQLHLIRVRLFLLLNLAAILLFAHFKCIRSLGIDKKGSDIKGQLLLGLRNGTN
jgi:hypothetical protein